MQQTSPESLTPVEKVHDLWVKREDAFEIAGVRGGKARACLRLMERSCDGVVTASARHSPQSQVVARIAEQLCLPCRIHTAEGAQTPELADAIRHSAVVIGHRAGYTRVINARARTDCELRKWTLIPFGMESSDAVEAARCQVFNIPISAKRLVVPVGSGITLAGILHGILDVARLHHRQPIQVLGVQIGGDPSGRLNRWGPTAWKSYVRMVRSPLQYSKVPKITNLYGIPLDPVYEAKCLPFLVTGDCLWIVGCRPGVQ